MEQCPCTPDFRPVQRRGPIEDSARVPSAEVEEDLLPFVPALEEPDRLTHQSRLPEPFHRYGNTGGEGVFEADLIVSHGTPNASRGRPRWPPLPHRRRPAWRHPPAP